MALTTIPKIKSAKGSASSRLIEQLAGMGQTAAPIATAAGALPRAVATLPTGIAAAANGAQLAAMPPAVSGAAQSIASLPPAVVAPAASVAGAAPVAANVAGVPIAAAGEAGKVSKAGMLGNVMKFQPATLWGGGIQGPATGARTAIGGALGPGSMGRSLAYGAAGQLASGVWDSAVGQRDGNWDDGVSGALAGAGIGAGIGSVIMPGVGTAVGAVGGALVGGVAGWLTGEDSPETEAQDYLKNQTGKLTETMAKYGIEPETQKLLMSQLGIMGTEIGSKEEAKALYQGIVGQLPAILQQQETERSRQANMAAAQGWLQPMIEQQLAMSNSQAGETVQQANAAAKYVNDPELAALYRKQAADLQLANTNQNTAYLGQMAATPALYGYAAQPTSTNPQDAGASLQAILEAQLMG